MSTTPVNQVAYELFFLGLRYDKYVHFFNAFTVAILAGLAAGNPAITILVRALIAMVLCYPMGLAVGLLCRRVVDEHAGSDTPREETTAATPEPTELTGDDTEPVTPHGEETAVAA